MADNAKFVKADGTLLTGKDAELELAKHDAEKLLKELRLDSQSEHSNKKSQEGIGGDLFEGIGKRLRSAVGSSSSQLTSKDSSSDAGRSSASSRLEALSEESGTRRESEARDEAEKKKINEKIKNVSPQLANDSQAVWKFSRDAEDYVYHFSLDIDTLLSKATLIIDKVQGEINKIGYKLTSYLDQASEQTDSAFNTLEKFGDMSKNIKDGSEILKDKVKEKTNEVTGFTKNLNDRAQKLAKSASTTLKDPLLQNVADMSSVSESIGEMADTGEYLTVSFNNVVETQSEKLQDIVSDVSAKITKLGESSGVFPFIKELTGEIAKHLKELSKILKTIKDKISGFLNMINGLFEKIFTGLAKLRSIIEGVLGLDIQLMKEALKNGTIRPTDVRIGRIEAHMHTEVHTKSSTDITGANVTAGNISAAAVVKDNSKSGHIEVAAVDVKTGNVDAALVREGKSKRNLAFVKGAGINACNVRATAIDDREVDSAAVGASAAEVNIGNVEAFGLGRKGTHRHTTAQPSLTVGNVAIGVRRSTGTNLRVGPHFSAGNIDLTISKPSLTNFLNQLGPGQAFGNIAIPFLGGGGGEIGGKSDGSKGSQTGNAGDGNTGDGLVYETAGDSTYGLARDIVEYGRPGNTGGNGGSSKKDDGKCHGNFPEIKETEGPSSSNGGYSLGSKTSESSGSKYCKGSEQAGTGLFQGLETSEKSVKFGKGSNTSNSNEKDGKGGSGKFQSGHGSFQKYGKDKLSDEDVTKCKSSQANGNACPSQQTKPGGTNNGNTSNRDNVPGTSSTNALGSGVYQKGDAARDQSEDDYKSRLASLVKGQVRNKVGDRKKSEKKTENKRESKQELLDNEAFKRQLLQECKEDLEQAEGASAGAAEAGAHDEKKVKAKPKTKAKPWGEHGNIHGFSTLGTESDKEIKKLGYGIYGFGDG